MVKSLEEFEEKRSRGDASMGSGQAGKYGRTYNSYFAPYNQNGEENRTIQRFLQETLEEMRGLAAVIDAYDPILLDAEMLHCRSDSVML